MKRILSLAMVLVMLFSTMPMASATEPCSHAGTDSVTAKTTEATCSTTGSTVYTCSVSECGASWTVTIPALNHKNTEWAPVEGQEANCVTAGKAFGYCPDCKNAVTKDVPATGVHSYDETVAENVHFYEANCKEPAKKTVKCKFCSDVKTTTSGTATGIHSFGDDNICDTILQDGVSRCGYEQSVTFDISATEVTVKKGSSTTVTVSTKPADSTAAVTATSNSDNVAAVSVSGKTVTIEGKAVGTAIISISVAGADTKAVAVTVINDGAISCNSDSVAIGTTKTLSPTLTVNGKVITDVTFDFTGATANYGDKTADIKKYDAGVYTVTIAVKSFKIDGVAGNPDDIPDKTVKIAFYDSVTAEADVKINKSTFMFDDTGVFSSVEINDSVKSNPTSYTLIGMMVSGSSYYKAVLEQYDASSTVGKITNVASGAVYPFYSNSSNVFVSAELSGLKFTCLNKGDFDLIFELQSSEGLTVRKGVVTLNVANGTGDIEYSTTMNKSVKIDEDDFEEYWEDAGMTGDPSYVVFDSEAFYGDLYTSSSKSSKVESTDKFYFAGTSDRLGNVVYVPAKLIASSYEDMISFTIYGSNVTKNVSGVLTIKVGEKVNFTDVKTSDYFYDAVVWAVNEEITSGTSATTFSPAKTCTRAEVVTFLWRAAGEPDVTGYLPFTDVDDDAYYYDAVLWAYKNDITTGLTSTTFGPHSTVTRGQVVTFLWRAMDELSVSASNPFNDVKRTDYFYEAVLWAVKNDVTTGLTSTTFGPASGCTRGQIVTFLYRAYEGE